MDLLFYLVLIGIGVAADQGGGSMDEEFGLLDPPVVEDPGLMPEDTSEAPVEAPDVVEPPVATDSGFAAEDQTASGRMTTAGEVRPILSATRGSWVAVREWEGNDLLYFTNLLAWRCGLHQITYSVNGGPAEVLTAEPCYVDEGAPNALKVEGILPYVTLPLQSVQSVTVNVLYDDLSTDSADYTRDLIRID
jgi:hypothetical protein